MKSSLRILLGGAVLAGAFLVYTTHRSSSILTSSGSASWADKTKIAVTEAASPVPLDAEEQNTVLLYKKGLPSVVNITSTAVAFDFFYGPVPQEGQGSGFVIDKEGHILTNAHVIEKARRVEVTLSNRKKYPAEVIGVDQSHDIAVIKTKVATTNPDQPRALSKSAPRPATAAKSEISTKPSQRRSNVPVPSAAICNTTKREVGNRDAQTDATRRYCVCRTGTSNANCAGRPIATRSAEHIRRGPSPWSAAP